jgi:CO dehydrogenase maturation factor
MGRPEGPGCYCAANNMLRAIIDALADSYPWVVIDNEAGLEHLSRRTTRDVDLLFIVSDATVRGVTTAGRIAALLDELNTKVGRHYLIVNRAANGLSPELERAIEQNGLELLAVLPDDPLVAEFDAVGRPLVQLPADGALSGALEPVVATLLSHASGKEAAGAHHR